MGPEYVGAQSLGETTATPFRSLALKMSLDSLAALSGSLQLYQGKAWVADVDRQGPLEMRGGTHRAFLACLNWVLL